MPDIFVNPHANNDDRTPEAKPVWERTAATTIEPVDEPTADVIAEPEERKPASVGPAGGMATSFCKNPTNISFNQQRTDEKILLFLRRDFITNIHWIMSLIMA